MHARKIFELLMSSLGYVLISLLWFVYAVPAMIELDSDFSLIAAAFGSVIWLCATGCIVLYVVQKMRTA
ncbi:hypothetical protein [Pseudomonas brassicacearum]|jgi:hypothetical protein|uniref:Uncharacterized protein n=1 Tax=Pseudomonas brassicacearum subsp. neoaurantiaca TaxID=494916 RepID=A0A7V8RKH0_9PSED|nr:hypothetical protein [Pseudomonas brassicacearum]MBA1378077.1 hypothetical protein [Pseudomonas brassicacearum subsp. neoaurantiaca]